jgi:RNA polymerase sigma factor (sigma-70 family)
MAKTAPALDGASLTRWAIGHRIPPLATSGRNDECLGRRVHVRSEGLYLSHRELIERAIVSVCGRHRLSGADADDFAGTVRLHLVENDYAVLRRFQGRSTLRTYLVAVITHCFQDYRNARWGKWRPSAEARRLGPLAVRLETLLVRDGLSLDEAHETLRPALQAGESRETLEQLAGRFPSRSGRTFVSVDALETHPAVDADADRPMHREEAAAAASEATAMLARAVAALPPQDQLILRMRFEDDCSVADISRALLLDQKPLYRHIDHLLTTLRAALEAQGISATVAAEILRQGGFDRSTADSEQAPGVTSQVRPFDRSGRPPGQTARPQ